MLTMLLGGLWHGAAWTFVAWGALHGAVLCIERVWAASRPQGARTLPPILGLIITFHVVCLGWILFRSESFASALTFLGGFARWDAPSTTTPFLLGLIALGLGLHALPRRGLEQTASVLRFLPSPALAVVVALLMLAIEAIRPQGVAPFIYFQF